MNVLLADDSAASRRLAEVVLERAGYSVTTATDGAEAISSFERSAFPLVILDWLMPNVDGIEACRRIRGLPGGREAFILMVTGQDQLADLVAALGAGVDDYLMKPVSADSLGARILIAERRIQLDVEQRRTREELAAAQRLAGIGETSLALQHEINNPLTALLVHSQLLADEAADPALKADLELMVALTRRIAEVVRRLGELKELRSVPYISGSSMIDLSANDS